MNAQHTPGPWKVGEDRDVYTANEDCIAMIVGAADQYPIKPKSIANARLIAAAPELLNALEQLVKWMDDSNLSYTKAISHGPFNVEPVEYSVVTEACAAIAKATGVPNDLEAPTTPVR